jgi:hypothetical protein
MHRNIFSVGTNAKTVKGEKYGYLTGVLYLAPDSLSGHQVCPMARKAGCANACLNSAGRGAFTSVQSARIAKTKRYFAERPVFMADIVFSIRALVRKASTLRMIPLVRLNGTSDIRWESVPVTIGNVRYLNVMHAFPDVQFYDYTKLANRKGIPANYDLTFSYSGVEAYQPFVAKAVANGERIAVVFRNRAIVNAMLANGDTFLGLPVVDGDDTDIRHLDPKGAVVALYAKGKARRDQSGFVVG